MLADLLASWIRTMAGWLRWLAGCAGRLAALTGWAGWLAALNELCLIMSRNVQDFFLQNSKKKTGAFPTESLRDMSIPLSNFLKEILTEPPHAREHPSVGLGRHAHSTG